MPIQEQNIVFLQSRVMDDVPEGGGGPSGNVIADGVMNNVFPDISDLDRAYGNFRLRQVFLAVRTLSVDLYGGAKSVITALPTDDAIGFALFSTSSPFDTRTEAADAVQAYLYKGPTWHGYLNENHIAGMRALSVIQRVGTALPPIGRTLCLVQNEGLVNETEQYVRVTGVSYVETTFTDGDGDFVRWIVTLTLSDALRYNFAGHEARRFESSYSYTGKTRIRDTTVADATKYYGAQRLSTAAAIGDLQVRAASLFTRLVPSAQTETPLVNRTLAGELVPMIASASAPVTYTTPVAAAIAPSGRLVLRTGAMPGSISATVGAVTVTDDGAGNARYNGTTIGTVDYAVCEIQFNAAAPNANGPATVTYLPGVAVAQQAHTRALEVTAENRRLNWVETLLPIPAPGALEIAYMSQGNWYLLRDDGTGAIVGSDATFGAGTVSFVTGASAVTLGALPDVGSQIMYTWASPAHYEILVPEPVSAAEITIEDPRITDPIEPGTLTLTWQVGGLVKTATDNGSGTISGDAPGTVDYAAPRITFAPPTMPDAATNITVAYTKAPRTTETPASNTVAVGAALGPYGVQAHIRLDLPDGTVGGGLLYDDGAGNLKLSLFSADPYFVGGGPYYVGGTAVLGTVNYATGAIVVNDTVAVSRQAWANGEVPTWQYQAAGSVTATLDGLSYVLAAGASPGPANITVPVGETPEDMPVITIGQAEPTTLVAASMSFSYGGKDYVERGGTLYADIDPTTGSGIEAGSVNYTTREARVTYYAAGATGVPVLRSALGRFGAWTATAASFRAPVSPLKPESVGITATTTDGVQITGASDPDGVVSGTWMRGAVNYEFGTGTVEFGQLVEGVWTPRDVDPSSIRYNAVAYTYLPLDADVLGIDPVRLPPDGRVPIYRAGDLVLVMHADETAPATIADGGTIDCGRTRLAWVRVLDANGATVASGYTVDRAAGIVTFPSVAGLAQPLTVRHTVADLRQVTDAQISGQLTLSRPLTHAFPADETIVASCLIHGDRRARVSAVWDQQTWDGTWVDNLVGNAATATLNTIAYPVSVTNDGAETERWLLRWTSTTNVELIGERVGLVFSGPYTADIAPINPRTREPDGTGGVPYLTIPLAANGGGWSAGNVVRINTVGAIADIWIARAIQQSDEPAGDGADGCELYALGNIDRP